ncbi:MAG: PilT protein domain protein [Proteobacteria bacterium]|jgi:tRNA(fMet)-specific endonuclease VapC|nr:PilT protein domain protein [Pseudomonadota bacterium]
MTQTPHYLLDTNILSELVRHPQGAVAQAIARVGENAVCTSIIVASELRFGAAKRNAPRLAAQVEAILRAIEVRPFDTPADHEYARLRLHLEQAGTPIGPNDMLIAAHALAIESILVTANKGEFSRVPGLTVENWLEAPPSV